MRNAKPVTSPASTVSKNAKNSPPDTEKCRLNGVQTAFFDREIMRRTLSNVPQRVQRPFHLPPLQYHR
ncbi:hypothetical protein DDG46_11565 [Neisseria gonorrhoeae]